MKKRFRFIPIFCCLLFVFALPVHADSTQTQNEMYDYSSLLDNLPEDVRAMLPEGLEESKDETEIAGKINGEYLAGLCSDLFRQGIGAGLRLFASLLGLILVCGVLQRCGDIFLRDKTPIFEYALLLIAALEIYSSVYSLFELTRSYISQINDYMTGISAAMGGIFLLSANVGTAAVQSAWFGLLLTVSEKISYQLLFPLLQISFALTLVSSLCPEMNLRSVTAFIRQICTTLLVGAMTLITVLMSFQTSIASAADSLGMRSIKFAASNVIPLIGGLVSDSLRTMAASLTLVKSTAGLVSIVGLLLCALLPLAMLFTCKYSLSLSGVAADLLQTTSVKPLIEEAGKLVGFLIAIILIFSIFYLFTLAMLIHTANALV